MDINKNLEQSIENISKKTIIGAEESHAKKFVNNIENMKNPHIRDCVSLAEKYGTIEDYSKYQEREDLENYRKYLNSSAYDEIKDCRSCQNMSCRVENSEKPIKDCLGYIHHEKKLVLKK